MWGIAENNMYYGYLTFEFLMKLPFLVLLSLTPSFLVIFYLTRPSIRIYFK